MIRTRHLIVVSVAVAALLSACTGSASGQVATSGPSAGSSPPSASCSAPLVEQVEGPFYTPGAPVRTDITDEATVGIPLLLTGRVLAADCSPVAGTMIDFWQADGAGVYDNEGYSLRGR